VVSPVLYVAIPLAVAFLLPLLGRRSSHESGRAERFAARALQAATLATVLITALVWMRALLSGIDPVAVTTGGWPPPLGINLRLGAIEALLVALAAATGLGVAVHGLLGESSAGRGAAAASGTPHGPSAGRDRRPTLELLMFVGAAGLIMTRDVFNMFVFVEIASIATYALAVSGEERRGLEAGFKYMFLGAVGSVFLLIAIAFLYRATGTLNLDAMAGALPGASQGIVAVALAFLLVGMAVELKLFPLNGPGIDLYEGVSPGVMALVGGTTVNAALYAFWKMQSLFAAVEWTHVIAAVGAAGFVVANLLAVRQKNVRRMLGYSTSAQLGLAVFLLPLVVTGVVPVRALVLLIVNHTLAKAGLLWLVGAHGGEELDDWRGAFARSPLAGISLAVLVLSIAGLPPFPGFWGKWQALTGLAGTGYSWWIVPILVGSMLEFVYYFGWMRRVHDRAAEGEDSLDEPHAHTATAPAVFAHVFALSSLGFGVWLMRGMQPPGTMPALALGAAGIVLVALRRLPERVLAALSLLAVLAAAWALYTSGRLAPVGVDGFFMNIVVLGAVLAAVAAIGVRSGRRSYHGLQLLLVSSLALLVGSRTLLGFFVAWEMMTWISYLLVASGKRAARAGYVYMLFSGAAGYAIFGGLLLLEGQGIRGMGALGATSGAAGAWAVVLLAVGFAVKAAAAGFHVWAPGAYAEAPDVFSSFLSGVVSKMPVFGLVLVGGKLAVDSGLVSFGAVEPTYLIGWVGAITAFGMTLLAALQEDAKKLLAYSSVGQIGYIVVGLAMLTPLGWSAALYQTVNHFLVKMLLFLAIAGVVHRTGTRNMHEMGGLIKKMPASYIAVLIGIIALSGVPPLSGFASKWLIYSALVERGWYFIAGLTMFASVVAFLYLFRLIHNIFLGQLKPEHREVREAPLGLLISQAVLVMAIMGLSMFPEVLLRVISATIAPLFGGGGLRFLADGSLEGSLGYLNAFGVMAMVMGLFAIFFAFILFVGPKTKKVRQLDIVYSAELPPPPEEIHYSYDFYRPYKRAFAPLLRVSAGRGWNRFASAVERLADVGRRFYTGDAQTYLVYAVAFLIVVAFVRLWV
jgi:formate hydrogenlyase subunit 3/multisubunit Na+/H+ antiporter MnhD subunit